MLRAAKETLSNRTFQFGITAMAIIACICGFTIEALPFDHLLIQILIFVPAMYIALRLGIGSGIFATLLAMAFLIVPAWLIKFDTFQLAPLLTIGIVALALAVASGRLGGNLRYSEERYRDLFDNASDMILLLDAEGNILDINRRGVKLTGYPKEELLRMNIFQDLVTPEWVDVSRNTLKKLVDTGSISGAGLALTSRSGWRVDLEANASALYDDKGNFIHARCIVRDISERKRAAKQIRLLSRGIDGSWDGILFLDLDGIVTYINQAALKVSGWRREDLVGNYIGILLPNPEEARNMVQAVLEHGRWRGEARYKRRDGVVSPIELTCALIRDSRGSPLNILVSVRDITERKRTEEQIRLLSAGIESTADGIFILRPDGTVTYANDAALRAVGWSREELIGKNIAVVFPDSREPEALIQAALRDGFWRGEITYKRKGGRLFSGEVSLAPIKDDKGDPIAIVVGARDVTERKKAEEAIQQRAHELAILNAISATISQFLALEELLSNTLDKVLEVMHMPSGGIFLVDKEQDEIVFRVHRNLSPEFVQGVYRMRIGEGLNGEVAQTGRPVCVEDISADPRLTRYGSERNGMKAFAAVPLRSKESILGVLCVTSMEQHSIPPLEMQLLETIGNQLGVAIENAQLYAQVKGFAHELEQRVAERTTELEQAHIRLLASERLAAIGQLAASVAHELRNPLGVINNSVNFLSLILSDGDEKVKKHLKILHKEVALSAKIINNLLSFARQKELLFEEADVNSIVTEALSRNSDREKAEITLELGEGLPTIKADKDQIAQVFLNLISNAVDAMPEGGRLAIRTEERAGFIETEFSDTGAGIPQGALARIFEPLFSTKIRGIGLGLAISKSIIERHGGSIEVESEVGKGSTFTVILPANQRR